MPTTPHKMSKARKGLVAMRSEYVAARKLALDTNRALKAEYSGSLYLARERNTGAALMARIDYWQALHFVAKLESQGIETGAAWSPNHLANVRAAAKNR